MPDTAASDDVLDVVIRRLRRFYGAAETAMELACASRISGVRGIDPKSGIVIWDPPATDEERENLDRLQKLWAQARHDFREEAGELLTLATALGQRLTQNPFDPDAVHHRLRLLVQDLHDQALRYIFIIENPFSWLGSQGAEMREMYGDNWQRNIDRATAPLRQLHRLLVGMREATGMSVAEAEKVLGLDKGTIRKLAGAGEIDGTKNEHGDWMLIRSSVVEYAAKHRRKKKTK